MDAEDGIGAGRQPVGSVGSAESRSVAVSGESAQASEFGELAVPEPEPTGHAEVDAALERLRELGERPTGAHPDLYDGVHQRLQDVLAQLDQQDAGR